MKIIENCPVCNGSSFSDFLQAKDYLTKKGVFSIVECDDCKFHFTNPIPEASKIGDFYKSDKYISHSSTKKGAINFLYNIIRNRTLRDKLSWILQETSQKKLLDIGAGTGHFLKHALCNDFEIEGLEPDEDARMFAHKENQLNLRPSQDLYSFDKSSFDIITMWHVLEHVYDLRKDLNQITSLLKEDGVLFIAVPNMNSYDAKYYKKVWAAYDLPRHLYHFKKENIESLLQQFGFSLTKVIPMKYDAYYVSMLSEQYKNRSSLFGVFRGFRSNSKASKMGYSSQVYVFRKKD